jgi:hypothetical protein
MIYKIFLFILFQQALRGYDFNYTDVSDQVVDPTMFLEDE